MRRIFATLLLVVVACAAFAQQPARTFVFVKINDPLGPVERGAKYEDPLNAALREAKLGAVTGGGTMMNKDRSIAWVGVDVDLYDVERGVPFLISKLRDLGAPPGSVIEYTSAGRKTQQPVH